MNKILELIEINTFYDRSHILFDVSLEVSLGETVCLMGRNGVGKTTTFRSIIGLTPPKTGKVIFKGEECTAYPTHKRARLGIGFVPEDRRVLGPFTIKENLELGQISGRSGQWGFDSVFNQFPVLSQMANRIGGTLSGGEQQMLTIARALMGNPDLLMLDEPSEGLSPLIVGELKKLIQDLKAADTTILLSEQNLKFALAVSDRVVILDKGHIVYGGTTDEFRKQEAIQKKYLAV